jgi:hypothetical protein
LLKPFRKTIKIKQDTVLRNTERREEHYKKDNRGGRYCIREGKPKAFLSEEEETEMAVESIKDSEKDVKDKEDEKVISEVNFDEIGVFDLTVCKERECKIVEEKIYMYKEESPLDMKIVRRREDRAEEKKMFEEWNEEGENENEADKSEAVK